MNDEVESGMGIIDICPVDKMADAIADRFSAKYLLCVTLAPTCTPQL